MDTLPLDHNPVPATGPRNLALSLGIWLRRMGFAVLEQGGIQPTGLVATWVDGGKRLYELHYLYTPTGSVLRLGYSLHYRYHTLVDSATVHRLREARFLLLSSTQYATARQAALEAGTLQPTYAQHTD